MSNLIATILFLSALGGFFGYLNPAYQGVTGAPTEDGKSIAELRSDLTQYEDALSKAREIEEARTGLLQAYNAIPAENLARLETLLPDYIDSVRFIIEVNTLATSHHMTLKNVSVEESGKTATQAQPAASSLGPVSKTVASVGVLFTVSGAYGDFRAFLRDAEQSVRLAEVRKVAFSSAEGGVYDFALTLVTYRLLE